MRIVRGLGLVCLALASPVLLAVVAIAFGLADVCFFLFGKRKPAREVAASGRAASVVIPNWNGRDLLAKFLPSVIVALQGNPANEVIVVDNASTDGSAEFLQENFPGVRVLPQERNLGFGGGSNAGFQAAKNDIAILLNNDMRVEPDFLAPLLEPFADPLVFSVSCQIYFSDPKKRREETGLTETWWERGRLRVSHRVDPRITVPFPCAYPGGGSSAFDRRKFLELGGFDELFRPFYYEDTALGYLAWKRGWKVLYAPRSVVYHEHRGTIGTKFRAEYIARVVNKNALLYVWKNVHDWGMLAPHFWASLVTILGGTLTGNAKGRQAMVGLTKAFRALPEAVGARWRARELAQISDDEVFRRQRGGYFRDRFEAACSPAPERLRVLFLSPYPIEPPVHGGAVFMKQTLEALQAHADVHLLSFVDDASQLPAQESLRAITAGAEFFVREGKGRRRLTELLPHVIYEFGDREFAWAIDRAMFLEKIDVVQIEYTILGQYGREYKRIPSMLFEHDISFQSLGRSLKNTWRTGSFIAYMQLLRYETNLVKRFTRVQVCSEENARYLLEFVPELEGRIDSDLRAVIDTASYRYVGGGREPNTILFVGSVRHTPNLQALIWFLDHVFPRVLAGHPEGELVIAGAGSWEALREKLDHPQIRLLGFVPDMRVLFEQYAVFICPILSGSGVRVKLLEAFASGIPAVSTRLGAEGLANEPGEICELADAPEEFARAVVRLLRDPAYASGLAARARQKMEHEKDAVKVTARLVEVYRREVARVRGKAVSGPRSFCAAPQNPAEAFKEA
jgi:O-antigen biosynthesis protein